MTKGEYLVGIDFNPSDDDEVGKVKRAAADLIDLVEASGKDPRTKAVAITAIEDGAMWAVKSITKDLSKAPDTSGNQPA